MADDGEEGLFRKGKELLEWAQEESKHKQKRKPGKICLVVPGIYQGNRSGGGSKTALLERNVKGILSVGGGPQRVDGFQFLHCGCADGDSIIKSLDQLTDFIQKNLESGGGCFVHCMGGFSRSPTVVIAYLIKYRELSLKDALEIMKDARPASSPHRQLRSDLLKWEKELRGQNSMELADFS